MYVPKTLMCLPHSGDSLDLHNEAMQEHLRNGFYELRMLKDDAHFCNFLGEERLGLLLVKLVTCGGCGSWLAAHELRDHQCVRRNLTQGSMFNTCSRV